MLFLQSETSARPEEENDCRPSSSVTKSPDNESSASNVDDQLATTSLIATYSFDDCGGGSDLYYEYEDWTQNVWVRDVFVILYVMIAVTSVIGNFMVIWTIVRHRHMRTVTNYYILNLAVADFLVALVVMPLKLIEYAAPCRWQVFRHDALCPLLYYVLPVFVFASVLTLAAISIERYYAIVHPLSALLVHSKSRTRKTIVATWVVPVVLASPYLYCRSYTFTIYSEYGAVSREICTDRFDEIADLVHFRRGFFLFLFIVVYLVPLVLIGGTCLRIAIALHSRPTDTKNAAPNIKQREENKRRVARMIMLIAMSFWICWTPFYTVTAVTQLQTDSFLHKSQFLFTMLAIHLSGFANSCLNPFIYSALSNKFRRSFKQMLRYCCCCIWRLWRIKSDRERFCIECQELDNNRGVRVSATRRQHYQLQPITSNNRLQQQQQPSKHVQLKGDNLYRRKYMRQSVLRACSDYDELHGTPVVLEMRVTTR